MRSSTSGHDEHLSTTIQAASDAGADGEGAYHHGVAHLAFGP
jgi:hypothetical protein